MAVMSDQLLKVITTVKWVDNQLPADFNQIDLVAFIRRTDKCDIYQFCRHLLQLSLVNFWSYDATVCDGTGDVKYLQSLAVCVNTDTQSARLGILICVANLL